MEAISDALRFEVRDFGVAVSIIEPGLITTEFGDTAASGVDDTDTGGDYGDFNRAVAKATAEAYEGPMAKLGGGPDKVARKILKAISARRPRTRYPITASARVPLTLHAVLPDRGWDAFVATQFPRPGKT